MVTSMRQGTLYLEGLRDSGIFVLPDIQLVIEDNSLHLMLSDASVSYPRGPQVPYLAQGISDINFICENPMNEEDINVISHWRQSLTGDVLSSQLTYKKNGWAEIINQDSPESFYDCSGIWPTDISLQVDDPRRITMVKMTLRVDRIEEITSRQCEFRRRTATTGFTAQDLIPHLSRKPTVKRPKPGIGQRIIDLD